MMTNYPIATDPEKPSNTTETAITVTKLDDAALDSVSGGMQASKPPPPPPTIYHHHHRWPHYDQ